MYDWMRYEDVANWYVTVDVRGRMVAAITIN